MALILSFFHSLRLFRPRWISMFMAIFALFVILLVMVDFQLWYSPDEYAVDAVAMESMDKSFKSRTDSSDLHRKLLQQGEAAKGDEEPNRIWGERSCSSDVVINQGPTPPLPNGIPTYTVEITNVCDTGCKISALHLHCGWFSSARLINPRIFKRLKYDDCLVNDGKPLLSGRTISFAYANTFPYQLSVASVRC